ncbi:pre-mRNA-splicing regulator female-lethal(2)D isoform X2 [Adelges cooleyi]|uniref:pre-mRNA-splicing regulator female-lethal(2)D isoform X2 n=1 Tax=Adelges cooleyi TaxID=133065 RepID=UPI00217FB0D4|nr:pre-mRNA-splicing regulator female-lethal(2)D isoform X2 [Adelges cooleyi]
MGFQISTICSRCNNRCDKKERTDQAFRELMLREKVLLRKLAIKEQEINDYAAQLSALQNSIQSKSLSSLKCPLQDPAVNLLVQKLRQDLSDTKTRLEETQSELNAWKFTPDSNTGKRLMAKCRLLYQENEELGKMVNNGRIAKLEGELALQKNFSEEVKKSQSELDEFLQDLDEDVEGMQSTIYFLQNELQKIKGSKQNCNSSEEKEANPKTAINGVKNNNAINIEPKSKTESLPTFEVIDGSVEQKSQNKYEKPKSTKHQNDNSNSDSGNTPKVKKHRSSKVSKRLDSSEKAHKSKQKADGITDEKVVLLKAEKRPSIRDKTVQKRPKSDNTNSTEVKTAPTATVNGLPNGS